FIGIGRLASSCPHSPSAASSDIYTLSLHDALPILRAYSEGRGIVDYPFQSHARDRQDWEVLIRWLDAQNSAYEWLKDEPPHNPIDRKSTRLNSSHVKISYAVFCLKKKIRNNAVRSD